MNSRKKTQARAPFYLPARAFYVNFTLAMKKTFALLLAFLGFQAAGVAQFQVGSVTVTPSVLTSNLHVPWELIWGLDDFIWMTERDGRISRVNPVTGAVLPLLTLPDVVEQSEAGLLGMALHPNFAQNPQVFLAYTYTKNGNLTEKLVRYTYNGTALVAPLVLLDNINATSIHNGSRLLILPDNTLLMTTGDAANTSLAQNLNSLNGKILRLNLDGTIPANNPIPNSYMYSYGHRNPQGLLRAPNGNIYSSEHGPNNDDEFNLIEPNRNYGWPNVEGLCDTPAEQTFCAANNVREPLANWTPTLAVAGIAYYNHPAIPGWQNQILLATLKASQLLKLELNANGTAVTGQTVYLNGVFGRLRAICVSPAGKVYISTSTASNDKIIVLENLAYNPTGSAEQVDAAESFSVFPDPENHRLRLIFGAGSKPGTVKLYHLTGRKVLEKPTGETREMALDIAGLKPGIYLIRAGKTSRKIMIP